MSFEIGDRVMINDKYIDNTFVGEAGTVLNNQAHYLLVKLDNPIYVYNMFMLERELTLLTNTPAPVVSTISVDCNGTEIKPGDVIVYFTRCGSSLNHQTAKVEFIGVKNSKSPHIRVLKQDAVQKDLFTRKSWLWSFDNSVKVG